MIDLLGALGIGFFMGYMGFCLVFGIELYHDCKDEERIEREWRQMMKRERERRREQDKNPN